MSKKPAPTEKSTAVRTAAKKSISKGTDDIIVQLTTWAHEGTQKALDALEDFIIEEKNTELVRLASMMFDEAQYLYYVPQSEKEEKDFELARMIALREERVFQLLMEKDRLEEVLEKQDLEARVHARLIKKADPKKKEAWKYRDMGDLFGYGSRLKTLKEDLAYDTAWIDEARSMITTKKYKDVPEEVFHSMNGECDCGECFDDMEFDDDMMDMDDDVCCPMCGSDDIEKIDSCLDSPVELIGDMHEILVEDIPF